MPPAPDAAADRPGPDRRPLRDGWLDRPHPSRLDPDRPDHAACLEAHRRAVERREAGYLDPATGLFVLTATHLAARPCCEQGCRHCPWVV